MRRSTSHRTGRIPGSRRLAAAFVLAAAVLAGGCERGKPEPQEPVPPKAAVPFVPVPPPAPTGDPEAVDLAQRLVVDAPSWSPEVIAQHEEVVAEYLAQDERMQDRTVSELLRLFSDLRGSLRRGAAYALGSLNNARAVPALLDVLRSDDEVAAEAVRALGRLSMRMDSESAGRLADLGLSHADESVRTGAVDVLSALPIDGINPLLTARAVEGPDVARDAARKGLIGRTGLVESLTGLQVATYCAGNSLKTDWVVLDRLAGADLSSAEFCFAPPRMAGYAREAAPGIEADTLFMLDRKRLRCRGEPDTRGQRVMESVEAVYLRFQLAASGTVEVSLREMHSAQAGGASVWQPWRPAGQHAISSGVTRIELPLDLLSGREAGFELRLSFKGASESPGAASRVWRLGFLDHQRC